MRPNRELKRIARENLIGNFRIPMGAFIFSQLLSSLLMMPFSQLLPDQPTPVQLAVYLIASFLILVLTNTLFVGELYLHLSLIRKQPISLGMIFYGFKTKPDRFIIGALIALICNGIWMVPASVLAYMAYEKLSFEFALYALLAAVAGLVVSVIVALYLAFFLYLLIDYPNATIMECFTHSAEMMKGHKGQFFGMICSFIGMAFLSVISFGIALFWVEPYMNQSFALFYLDVKGELSSIREAAPTQEEYTFNTYV